MVRLRLLSGKSQTHHPKNHFQSHCGAIATNDFLQSLTPTATLSIPLWCDCDRLRFRSRAVSSCTFNPTVVRLRPSSSYDTSPLCFLSIPLWCDCDADRSIFGCRPDYLSFNPTVVRLRPQDRRQCNEPHGSFNPTVVRLRHIHCHGQVRHATSFQSHCGAIATIVTVKEPPQFSGAFNPTVVRLRPEIASVILAGAPAFNPTVVRLRP